MYIPADNFAENKTLRPRGNVNYAARQYSGTPAWMKVWVLVLVIAVVLYQCI